MIKAEQNEFQLIVVNSEMIYALMDVIRLISSEIVEIRHHNRGGLPLLLGWEHIPKSESLIPSTRYQSLPVWTGCKIKNTVRVACKSRNLFH